MTGPKASTTVSATDLPTSVMATADQSRLLDAVRQTPQGVHAMSEDVPGLVETSGNIGVLSVADGRLAAVVYVRSSIDAERDAAAARFADVVERAGCTTTTRDAYSGWPPDPDSPILALMSSVYEEEFGTRPDTVAVHAGLETGLVLLQHPDMDMVSVGPTPKDVHLTRERLEVASVSKAYGLVTATLSRIE